MEVYFANGRFSPGVEFFEKYLRSVIFSIAIFRNGDRKIMQLIRLTSRTSTRIDFFLYENNFLRTMKLKSSKNKNNLRTN